MDFGRAGGLSLYSSVFFFLFWFFRSDSVSPPRPVLKPSLLLDQPPSSSSSYSLRPGLAKVRVFNFPDHKLRGR